MLDAEQQNGERRVPDLPAGIPELDALDNDRMRRFCLEVFQTETYVQAAGRAGYSGKSGESLRNQASRLAQMPKVRAAINALARANYGSLGPLVIKQLVNILKDPTHIEHGKTLRHVAGALWPAETRSTQQINVTHRDGDLAEREQLARRLAEELGIDPVKFLGCNRSARRPKKQIEATAVETKPEEDSNG